MTIFPCSRCGEVPEVSVYPETNILTMAVIRHECSNGRRYFQSFKACDEAEATNGVIYCWNETEAKNNSAWWPERYDYLHALCKCLNHPDRCKLEDISRRGEKPKKVNV